MSANPAPPRARRWPIAVSALLIAALAGGAGYFAGARAPAEITPAAPEATKPDPDRVTLPLEQWATVGLMVEPATEGILPDMAWRPARIALDDEKTAHLATPVAGIVREVRVRIGQHVRAGDTLAIVEAQDAGVARLELARTKVAADAEAERLKWASETATNVERLVRMLKSEPEPATAEAAFTGKLLGDWREKLVGAYTERRRVRSALASANAAGPGVLPLNRQRQYQADADTAEAAFTALAEEALFQTRQAAKRAELKAREVAADSSAARARLIALGVPADAVDAPVTRESAGLFPVIAPVPGFVLMRNAVVGERAAPETMLFEVSDLTTVWIHADVFEPDLGLTVELEGKTVPFRLAGQTAAAGQAYVIDAGATVDAKTRAADLVASTPNADLALKPGQFAELGLPRPTGGPVVHVPLAAVQTNGGRSYVFTQIASDRFEATPVRVGRVTSDRAEIQAGLKAGTRVATAGSFILKSEWLKDTIEGE